MVFKSIDGPAVQEAKERFRRFRENEAVLERERDRLLAHHMHEWVAVYDDGKVVVEPTMEAIRDAIPDDKRGTAVVRYIRQRETALIL